MHILNCKRIHRILLFNTLINFIIFFYNCSSLLQISCCSHLHPVRIARIIRQRHILRLNDLHSLPKRPCRHRKLGSLHFRLFKRLLPWNIVIIDHPPAADRRPHRKGSAPLLRLPPSGGYSRTVSLHPPEY